MNKQKIIEQAFEIERGYYRIGQNTSFEETVIRYLALILKVLLYHLVKE